MSAGHTPGPWATDRQLAQRDEYKAGPAVASVYRGDRPSHGVFAPEVKVSSRARMSWQAINEEGEANARLIASAPELLASLEALIEGIDEWNRSVEEIIGRFPDYEWGDLEGARKAVAKARGEES